MKPLLALFVLILSSQTLRASDEDPCAKILKREGAVKFERFRADSGTCFLGIDPFDVPANWKYRSFLMTDEGLFMVFNSYRNGMAAADHGARVFHFFPRKVTPGYTLSKGQLEVQTSAPGIEILFKTDKVKITGMNGGDIKESSSVSPSNSGGVQLSNVKTLYLDSGFMMGQDPTGNPDRESTFIDFKNNRCVVKNSEIFVYDSDGDSRIRYSDSELKDFLAQSCPELKVNF